MGWGPLVRFSLSTKQPLSQSHLDHWLVLSNSCYFSSVVLSSIYSPCIRSKDALSPNSSAWKFRASPIQFSDFSLTSLQNLIAMISRHWFHMETTSLIISPTFKITLISLSLFIFFSILLCIVNHLSFPSDPSYTFNFYSLESIY